MTEWSIAKVVKTINAVNKSKGDFICAVTGSAGIGKSTLVNQIVKEKTGENFSLEFFKKYNFYSRAEIDKQLESMPNNSCFIVDESINMLFKREWQNKDQIKIIQKFNTYRNKGFIIFLILPRFNDLDSAVRNSTRIKWWIHCISWGEGIIYQADDNEFNPDPWNLKINMKYLTKGRKRFNLSNYVSNIYWDEMDEKNFNIYEQVKAEKRALAYKESENNEISKKEIIMGLLKINPNQSVEVLSTILDTAPQYIYEIIRSPTLRE